MVAVGERTGLLTGRQFHNQPEASHQHDFLVGLWDRVREETAGRLDVTVHAGNGGIPGSDPQALRMLVDGELEFHTLMGGILGQVVPAMEIQGMPFVFPDTDAVFRAMDGALGVHLATECAAKGVHLIHGACFENGFRHIGSNAGPITRVEDLAGLTVRIPDGELFRDLFTTLGATPVVINIRELYAGLRDGVAAVQENALVVMHVNRLHEVSRHLSLTAHMWSGFNLLASGRFWARLDEATRDVVTRAARDAALAQRAHTARLNEGLVAELERLGMVVNRCDVAGFRAALPELYGRWRGVVGARTWALLEESVGRLA